MIQLKRTNIKDCYVINIKQHVDERGFFTELSNEDTYSTLPLYKFLQTNCSVSSTGVVRGMHIAPFAKLVTCIQGRIFDVAVDMRKESPSYLNVATKELLPLENQMYVPSHCAHGFYAFEDSVVVYQQTGTYNPKIEKSINWRDPQLNIPWPEGEEYIVSEKDATAPFLKSLLK